MASRSAAKAARGKGREREAAPDDATASAWLLRESAGLALVGLAVLAALALASYSPSDPVLSRGPVANLAGSLGASLAALLLRTIGAHEAKGRKRDKQRKQRGEKKRSNDDQQVLAHPQSESNR